MDATKYLRQELDATMTRTSKCQVPINAVRGQVPPVPIVGIFVGYFKPSA